MHRNIQFILILSMCFVIGCSNVVEECENLPLSTPVWDVVQCYDQMTKQHGTDPTDCAGSVYAWECVSSFAKTNVDICYNKLESYSKQSRLADRDFCITGAAALSGEWSWCHNLTSGNGKNVCYYLSIQGIDTYDQIFSGETYLDTESITECLLAGDQVARDECVLQKTTAFRLELCDRAPEEERGACLEGMKKVNEYYRSK